MAVLVAERQRVIISQRLFFLFLLVHARVPCCFLLLVPFHFVLELAQELNNLFVALNSSEMRGLDSALVLVHDVAVVLGEQLADFQLAVPCSIKQGSLAMRVFVVDIASSFNKHFTCFYLPLFGSVKQRCLVHVIIIVEVVVVFEYAAEEVEFACEN